MFKWMRCLVTVGMVAIAMDAAAQAPDDIALMQPPRLLIPTLPVYPAAELAANISGVVELVVEIDLMGRQGAIQSITSTPKSAAFEKAVTDALAGWKFRPAQRDCLTVSGISRLRATFAPGGETGSIAVRDLTYSEGVPNSVAAGMLVAPNAEAARRGLRYPSRAIRARASGRAAVWFSVDPQNGNVLVTSMTGSSDPQGFEQDFMSAAEAVVLKFRYQPIPGETKPVATCTSFDFRLN